VVWGIQGVDKQRKSTEGDHLEKECPAKKPNAIEGVGKLLAEKIMGRIYKMESEDEEL
jgi:hypothetical protein